MVPILRTSGSAIWWAHWLRIGLCLLTRSERAIPAILSMAPIARWFPSSLMYERPGILPRSIRWEGESNLSFISGIRLCPPARNFASVPYFSASDEASATDFGAWYSKGLGFIRFRGLATSVKSLPIEFGRFDALPSVQAVVKEETPVLRQPLKRVEDPKFITGTGLFADDITLPEMLHSVFVRSLYAHARIKRVDVTEALKQPAVRLVLTGQDLLNRVNKMPAVGEWGDTKPTDRPILPVDEVNFAGEAVALVVADDVYSAQDATQLVLEEYKSLPSVVYMDRAASPQSPTVHQDLTDHIW